MKEVKEDARGESVVVPVSSKGGDGMRGRGGWKMDVHDNDVMAQGRLNDATIKQSDEIVMVTAGGGRGEDEGSEGEGKSGATIDLIF